MDFTLNLTLRGLCASVPSEQVPLIPGAGPFPISRMRVLVLDRRQGGAVSGHVICPHQPRLEVEQLQGPDIVIPLSGHTIELNTGPLTAAEMGLKLQLSFWDVAQLEQVNGTLVVDNGVLADPPPAGVAGSLRLVAGSVEGIEQSLVPLRFPSTGYSGNFAAAVRIAIPISGNSGSFTLTPANGSAATVVTFSPRQGRTSVDATLRNMCDQEALPPAARSHSDFAAYYLLSPGFDGAVDIPEEAPPPPKTPGEVRGEAVDTDSCIPTTTRSNGHA